MRKFLVPVMIPLPPLLLLCPCVPPKKTANKEQKKYLLISLYR